MELCSEIKLLLTDIDSDFDPPLSSRISVDEYSKKIYSNSTVFSIHQNGKLAAFIAFYCNEINKVTAYITMVAVSPTCRGSGLGAVLIESCIRFSRGQGFKYIKLEVSKSNSRAIRLYHRLGFEVHDQTANSQFMCLPLGINPA